MAHLPAIHPYVGAIDPSAVVVADPWSVVDLERAAVDIVHVHFGFEHVDVSALQTWCRSVQSTGIRLVHTVHDLDNPHLRVQDDHRARTGVLVGHADDVVTLTRRAAVLIGNTFGREPEVIPHPPLVDDLLASTLRRSTPADDAPAPARPATMWLGTCRPNLDVEAVAAFVTQPRFVGRVVVRSDGWESCAIPFRAMLLGAHDDGQIELVVVERPDDGAFVRLIADAGVMVLPYAWGTHSGIVEMATDLGVPTVITDVGCHADQGAITVAPNGIGIMAARMLDGTPVIRRPTCSGRSQVRAMHRDLYGRARPQAAGAQTIGSLQHLA